MMFTGNQIGNVVSFPISGFLCSSDFLGGWPSVFYVFGTLGVIWFLFWAFLIYETPLEHPSISRKELKLFQMDKEDILPKKRKIPWKTVVTSLPMWAVLIAHCGHMFGFILLLTELPTYLSTILHINMESNGLLSALPYVVQALAAWGASFIADRLRRSEIMSITNIRKLSNSIGLFGPAVFLLGVTVSGCRPQLIVGLFSLCMATNGFIYSGFNVTHVDMSPSFAGSLFGITNSIANISGVIGPAIVGYFTSKGANIGNWNDVFYIAAAVYTFSAAFYAVFASAEIQPWEQEEKEYKGDIPMKDVND